MKKYSFVFWCGYVSNKEGKPSIQHVTEKDITEDNGFFDEDIKEIENFRNLLAGVSGLPGLVICQVLFSL